MSKARFIESEKPLLAAVRRGAPSEELPVKPVGGALLKYKMVLSDWVLSENQT